MNTRRISREVAMQVLFQWEAQGQLLRHHLAPPEYSNNLNIEGFLGQFLRNFYLKDKSGIDIGFTAKLIANTIENIVQIDQLIDEASEHWRISRMDAIDRAILRIACCELAIRKELSIRVVINEAIEIAKRYGSENSASFINGVLDSIRVNAN